jgi:trigger factor
MNVRVENKPHSQSLVTVEVEPERLAQAKEAAFRRIAREAVVPGFRKGKAPRNLVERFVRPEVVEDDAETHLTEEIWNELRTGQLKDMQFFDTPQVKVTQHSPLVLEITLTHEPSVQIGDYKDIRIAPELVTVTDDDVNRMIEGLRQEQSQWQPAQNRPVRQGDMVTIQAHGILGDQPIVVPEGYSLTVDEKSNWLTPGFAMRLVDAEVDKEAVFPINVPTDSSDKLTAGATGTAYVTVKEIKEKVTPALDDALAKTAGAESVADLTDKVRSSLLKQREEAARDRLEDKITDEIAKVSTIDFPEVFVTQ